MYPISVYIIAANEITGEQALVLLYNLANEENQ